MAIQFARCEFVQRSEGADICLKSAYNERGKVSSDRSGKTYSFADRGGSEFHDVLLPAGASEKFKDGGTLWNAVDKFETRKNARLAKELVLALPDDKEITLEDRIELTKRFANKYFVEKGVAVQVDIHAPHHETDKNWHAHLLVTTRRFDETGTTFAAHKARDLDGIIRKGLVIEADLWGVYWRDLQNEYFAEKGISLRVDEIGIIAQEHLGPVRMRKLMSIVAERNELNKKANEQTSLKPDEIIKHLTRDNAVFSGEELGNFLNKHISNERVRGEILSQIMEHSSLVPLYHKGTGEGMGWFTTKEVREQEERILREAERLNQNAKYEAMPSVVKEIIGARSFSTEQQAAFEFCVAGDNGIKVIQGRAGTGKSYVMQGIREAYEGSGKDVIGLGYTGAVAELMQKEGFGSTYTISGLLFRHKYNRINIKPGTVFVVDEAAMVPTVLLDELIKVSNKYDSKLILVGDDRQQNARAQSGLFSVFAEQFGAVELKTVRRQAVEWQKQMSEALSYRAVSDGINLLSENKAIHWHEDHNATISALVEGWCKNTRDYPDTSRLIIAHRNVDVDFINEAVHRIRQALNKVSLEEFVCETKQGKVGFSVGDRVQFTSIDRSLGLNNGEYGTLMKAGKNKFIVEKDGGETISFNPGMYKGLRHGYATTMYKAQGKTIEEVDVLYSPSLREKPSYVALTRQIKDVKLFISKEDVACNDDRVRRALYINEEYPKPGFTLDGYIQDILGTKDEKVLTDFYLKNLVEQISRNDEKLSSLHFYTENQLKKFKILGGDASLLRLAVKVEDTVKGFIHKHMDRLHQNKEFYSFAGDKILEPLEVTKDNAAEKWKREVLEIEAVEKPENESTAKTKQGQGADIKHKKAQPRLDASYVEEVLKKDIKGFAIHLLGEPDQKLSNAKQLVFRKDGKVYVSLEKGLWNDFKNAEGGNLFKLIQRERGGDFKEALAYAATYLGLSENLSPMVNKPARQVAEVAKAPTEDAEKAGKIKRIQGLYQKSIPIMGTLGEKYLRVHRGIQGELPNDLRFSNNLYNAELKKGIPALLAFARNKEGKYMACQVIYLNEETGNKANIEIAKKTFGALVGSFVTIQNGAGHAYIAEGVETALSIKEIGLRGTIVASLGVQNIKHFDREAKNLVICADNDGPNAPSRTVIEKSRDKLEKNGYTARIIEPILTGEDFNDVLKKEGRAGVAQYFEHEPRAQQEVHVQRSNAEEIQKAEPTTKANAEVSSSLTGTEKLDNLTKQYQLTLTGMYREKLGRGYKDYKEEIATVAHRAAKDAVVLGEPSDEGSLRVLFARNQYEISKSVELRKEFIAKDTNFVDNWMRHAFKADAIASIEGRLFAGLRVQKNRFTATELKNISKQASQEYEGNTGKLQTYIKAASKEMGDSHMAKMYAEQRVMFEERYGLKPSVEQLKGIKEAVAYGHSQYNAYQQEFTNKIKTNHGTINETTQSYIDQAAKYKAYNELKEIIPNVIASGAHTLHLAKELKSIEATVEKNFRADKQHYEQLHDQQKQAQKAMERQNSRGFER